MNEDLKNLLLEELMEDMRNFLKSRERRGECISIDTPMNKVNWSSITDSLPNEVTVEDVVNLVEEWESKGL